jgi:secondary thiamine-phosphate synthase enzyme
MVVYHEEFSLITKGENDIVDITNNIQDGITNSKITDGIICVFVPGSTGAITTMEYEPGLKRDIPETLERLAPKSIPYAHHETWHDDNGRSHVKASLIGPSISLPFQNRKLLHGTWQQIVFIELDTQSRHRTIMLQIVGE